MVREAQGQRFLKGAPEQQLMEHEDDVSLVLEACFANAVHCLLRYPKNLTPHFWDLSSGDVGAILQKLRNYHMRLVIVHSRTLHLSHRFAEPLADEGRGRYFRVFDERSVAQAWVCSG